MLLSSRPRKPRAIWGEWARRALCGALFVLSVSACSKSKESEPSAETVSASAKKNAPPADSLLQTEQKLFDLSSACELYHRGLVLDFSDEQTRAYEGFRLQKSEELSFSERSGVRLRKLDRLATSFDFWWTDESSSLEVTGLVQALGSDRLGISIDDRRVGTLRLKPGALQPIELRLREWNLSPGRHRLTIHLSRTAKVPPSAEIAWLRLGTQPRRHEADRPPARQDVFTEVTIGQERKRSIVLREGGSLRCPLWIAEPRRKLVGSVGIWGQGTGEVEILARQESGARRLLTTISFDQDDPEEFRPFEVELDNEEPGFFELEFSAPRLSSGVRAAFGEPTVVETRRVGERAAPAQRAFLFVLSGLSREDAPPRTLAQGLPAVHRLTQDAVYVPGYRTTSTSGSATLATLLSGLPPWKHGVGDTRTRFPENAVLLAERIQEAGIRTGMFTGVPTSSAAFGLDRGFEIFEEISPIQDLPAIEPLRRARAWVEALLDKEERVFTVVHLRGGHPPFDIPREEARDLPPAEYGGDLEPRRTSFQLGQLRQRKRAGQRILPEEDWVRLQAMRKRALLDQNAALHSFLQMLRERGVSQDSLIIVMGDVSSGSPPNIPYDERAPLTEDFLTVPLWIQFPERYGASRSFSGTFAPEDVFATILTALSKEEAPTGIDLGEPLAESAARRRTHIAYRAGRYATRLGPHLLLGEEGQVPRLCRVDWDPQCTLDRKERDALYVRALWFRTFAELSPALLPVGEPESLPESVQAALTVWSGEPSP